MTSTSVKDVSSVMSSYVSGMGSAVGSSVKTSFQDVWNNQTGKNSASDTSAADDRKVSDDMEPARHSDALKAKDSAKVHRKDDAVEDAKAKDLDVKKLEEAMEVLGTAVNELMQEIADAFGISMEELEQIMADMNMEPMDLLNTEDLSALLLEVGGVTDSMALLTDENLCTSFQLIMNRQKEMFAALSESLQMTEEQLTQFVEEMDTYTPDIPEEQMPEITVEVDSEQEITTESTEKAVNVLSTDAAEKTESNVSDKMSQENTGEQQSDNTKDQTGNLLLQNLKADAFKPELQQVNESTSAWSETTQNIMRQIMDFMKIQVKADTSSLEMQLHPASLGRLQVQVASNGGVLTASFVAENETVKAVLESQMVQLKESFAEQGVKVDAIEVTVQTHQFESNLEQGRGRQSEQSEKKSRTRRINLDAALGVEDLNDMSQEEQLEVEMMTASGSTVNYTV